MSEEVPPTNESPAPASPTRRKGRWWKWPAIVGGGLVLLPLVAFGLWALIALSFTYSSGDRAGYLTKFSEKGWVCKTWEGELQMVSMPGTSPEIWRFTVRDDSIADQLTKQIGNRVSLTYDEKRGVPTSCFGETSYFVKGVRRVGNP